MKNTKTIKLTYVRRDYDGICNEQFMSKTLFLKKARHTGDIEKVNHYVISMLNIYKKLHIIDYEILD